jgi:hypothetical protein
MVKAFSSSALCDFAVGVPYEVIWRASFSQLNSRQTRLAAGISLKVWIGLACLVVSLSDVTK